jgi:hypothetical protein
MIFLSIAFVVNSILILWLILEIAILTKIMQSFARQLEKLEKKHE